MGRAYQCFFVNTNASWVNDKMDPLKYAAPLSLFEPFGIFAREAENIWMLGALLLAGVLMFIIGLVRFTKKDMPL